MRLEPGAQINVTATERWFTEIRAGRAFTRGLHLAASVGNVSEIQLLNPAASGVAAIIRSIKVGLSVADRVHLRTYDTALGTAVGAGFNLLAGGTAAKGLIKSANPAAEDGTLIEEYRALVDVTQEFVTDWGWELAAGKGILIATLSANEALAVTFKWIEV